LTELLIALAALAAGALASVTGFGIGSLLTPIFATSVGAKLAVAVVSIPHFIGTALRFFLLREHVNKQVLLRFGLASAAGGLLGALLHTALSDQPLGIIFGVLLLFAGVSELTGFMARPRFHGRLGFLAGALSGLFGGLVGNQGGIRSAALLRFDLEPRQVVATATATGLIVDLVRMPVYLLTAYDGIQANLNLVVIAASGVVIGTVLGGRLLRDLPERVFRRVVALVLLALGTYMVLHGP
jgi:uncharacterized membrane protein YfcA